MMKWVLFSVGPQSDPRSAPPPAGLTAEAVPPSGARPAVVAGTSSGTDGSLSPHFIHVFFLMVQAVGPRPG